MALFIPGVSTPTTPLGFGCSQLMGGISRKDSVALLRTAYDAGIRHFDTAPSYGYGLAEGVLGEALRAKRPNITITTKYGLRPPRNRRALDVLRAVARPVVRHLPGAKACLARAAGGLTTRARFSAEELRTSIDASLTALGTDYIDILLLHEAVVADLSDDLLEALEHGVAVGKIRTFGVGSEATSAHAIHRTDRRFCPVLQFDWSVLDGAVPSHPGSFQITHRSLFENFTRLHAWLAANPATAAGWSNALDRDVADAAVLARLMLAAARAANPLGITLFSSRNADNIRKNATLLLCEDDLGAGASFARLVARDGPTAGQQGTSPRIKASAA